MEAVTGGACVTVNVCVPVQPLASVTVTVYVPAARPVGFAVVPTFGFQAYVYGPVPPEGVTAIAPLFAPLQDRLVMLPVAVTGVALLIVKVAVEVHPASSVTVTE